MPLMNMLKTSRLLDNRSMAVTTTTTTSAGSTQSSSDAPVRSSSPCAVANALTTPPSSPPEYPWQNEQREQDDQLGEAANAKQPRPFNVLAVLGKRKPVLQTTSHNARPAKRLQTTASRRTPNLTQMQLALGQKVEKKCEECGMVYVLSSSEDRRLHDRFHTSTRQGCDMGNEFVRKTPSSHLTKIDREQISTATDDVICVLTRTDQKWRRKYARDVLDIITSNLGACKITDEELWAEHTSQELGQNVTARSGVFEMYLYIRGGRCVSAAVVESLQHKARQVVRPQNSIDSQRFGTGLSTLEQLRARRQAEEAHDEQNLTLSDETYDVRTGISRIWTAPAVRGQNLATAILDEIHRRKVQSHATTSTLSKTCAVAFSQPTSAGARLARKWFGQKYGWLAYG